MSTTILSAMTVALLTAACQTALADSSTQQNRISTLGEPTADASGFIQAVGRNGSHSMHPNAPLTAEQFADEDVEVLQQTGSE